MTALVMTVMVLAAMYHAALVVGGVTAVAFWQAVADDPVPALLVGGVAAFTAFILLALDHEQRRCP